MEKENLKPEGVFRYFEEICKVPRPSKREEKIVAYLKDFGQKHQLETQVDEAGNVLIKKKATPGMENRKTVILQSHVDMVCEKNNDVKHDFLNDPIETEIDGEWMKAKGTTLGADNGIGVATELAVLTDDTIEHGPIECLFTVDEETGLTGASALKKGFMEGTILLNLDSEDEGELFIGCAGGVNTLAVFHYQETDVPANYFFCKIQVKGLRGGHSGGVASGVGGRFLGVGYPGIPRGQVSGTFRLGENGGGATTLPRAGVERVADGYGELSRRAFGDVYCRTQGYGICEECGTWRYDGNG